MKVFASKTSVRALVPLACAFAFLFAVAVVTAFLVSKQENDIRAIAAAMTARSNVLDLFSTLQDAETGQRGFLLKGEPAYFAPYLVATHELEPRLHGLEAALRGEPAALRLLGTLRSAATRKMEELERTIDLKQSGDNQAALAVVDTDEGLHLMEQARSLVAELRSVLDHRILEREQSAKFTGELAELSIFIAILASIAAAGFVLHDARTRERRLIALNEEREVAIVELASAAERRGKLEDQLRQAQKMEAVGQLTGGLAHDFNNMLAIIIGSLNMMSRRVDQGEAKLRTYIAMALDGAERATNLTHRLLSFSRRQPLSPEVLHLNKLLPGLSELLRRTIGETVQVETVLGGGLWYTKVDANQLESAILNLAVNARDAMPEGGKITLETGNAHLDEAYAAEHVEVTAGQYVMVALSDSGLGMSADILRRSFEPFFTTKAVGKGTGLGLSQVYGFVKQSGGHVKMYSEPGQGTTVKLYLPRCFDAALKASPISASAATAELPLGEARQIILVVEDEDGVRRLTVDALRDLNYTVIHASNGMDALRIFERQQEISLLLTDVVMPQLTGKQLVEKARELRPGLKALYMTGYTRNSIVHNGVIDPGVQLISKPFTIAQLAAKVRECVNATS